MSTFAIGDIQGCFQELQLLLEAMAFNPDHDKLWLVGDLINRGPDNRRVMDFVLSLGEQVCCVLGNHDLHFVAVASGLQRPSRSDTLDDLLSSPDCQAYVDWFRHQPLLHRDENLGYSMVHAGLPPQWSLEQAALRAVEVEQQLASDEYLEFLKVMYGNEPASWDDSLTGFDRLRIITNYFPRLRYCTSDGTLELTHKALVQPVGYAPWFSFPRPDQPRLIFGHWAAIEGEVDVPHFHALDTGCVWGRSLTGMCLETGQMWQQPALK